MSRKSTNCVVRIPVYVTPKASRNEVGGWRGGELIVRVTVAPEDGKANAAVRRLLAKALGVGPSAVSVVTGATSRHKLIDVDVDGELVGEVFGAPGAPGEGDHDDV